MFSEIAMSNSEAVHRAHVMAWNDFDSQTDLFPQYHSSNNQETDKFAVQSYMETSQ